jgi:hypothetical protein
MHRRETAGAKRMDCTECNQRALAFCKNDAGLYITPELLAM